MSSQDITAKRRDLYYSRHPKLLGAQGSVRSYIVPCRTEGSFECLSIHDPPSRGFGWNLFASPSHPKSLEAQSYLPPKSTATTTPAASDVATHVIREEMGVRIICTEGILSVGLPNAKCVKRWDADNETPATTPCPGVTIWHRVCDEPGSLSEMVTLGPGSYITMPFHQWFYVESPAFVSYRYVLAFFAMKTVGARTPYSSAATATERVAKYLAGGCSVTERSYTKLAKDYKLYFTS